ncbi:hypothetical protein BKA70DRAFT_365685 [Coprinopsis sp. MPI-PUGE-AT-0042]|nr:hypothetical protein BKA70DRAFT_365685 [Coprinopsis sp. MPI-PUGE-AT-0042]
MSTTARPGYCEAAQRVRPGSSLRGSRGERGFISLTVVKRPLYEGQGIDFFSYNVELRVGVTSLSSYILPNILYSLMVLPRSTFPESTLSRGRLKFSRLAHLSSRRSLPRARFLFRCDTRTCLSSSGLTLGPNLFRPCTLSSQICSIHYLS